MNIDDDVEPDVDRPLWFAVQSRPKGERQAAMQLRNQGFETFLPVYPKTRRHARKLQTVLAPFFPGYLFVTLDLRRDRWRSVNGTIGVARLVMAGGLPQPVPDGVVEGLRACVDADSVIQIEALERLAVGQEVRLSSGPFAEQVGRLARLDDNGRVQVLLEIMGAATRVELNADQVVPR